ncbi:MAG: TRAP transporter large permease subunit [Spirochaetota bacterium]|nr:TRAP transporter large permease subunit [Spirochaetota bacterium]
MIAFITIIILLTAFIGTPLFATLGLLPSVFFHYVADVPLQAMITQVSTMIKAPGLIALPLFTFMGYILTYSKTSQRIADFADNWLGWLPGGLAITTIISYTAFSAISGGSAIAVMALGGIYYAALLKAGYNTKFSLGICTVFGGGGMLFPPSLPVIILGFIAYISIDTLFVAAFIPGIIVVSIFLVYCIINAIMGRVESTPFSYQKAMKSLKDISFEIPLPFLIIGGIFTGWMSIVEVAIITLIYVIITQCLLRREVNLVDFKRAALNSMLLFGAIFAVMTSALTLSNFLIDNYIPQRALEFIQGFISSRIVFLLFLNIILLITGCLMDIFSAILVMVPLLLPVAKGYDIAPLHFAVIFLWNLEIGYSTPPIGFNLFVGSFRFRKPLETLWRAAIPGLIAQIIGLVVITYWPDLTLWLPRFLGMTKELIKFTI